VGTGVREGTKAAAAAVGGVGFGADVAVGGHFGGLPQVGSDAFAYLHQPQQTTLSADYLCNNDELQKIFDDLFNDPDEPIDFDRFCNEVIDEEFCSSVSSSSSSSIDDASASRDTTPSPVEATTTQTQHNVQHNYASLGGGYFGEEPPLPENLLADVGAPEEDSSLLDTTSTEAYMPMTYGAISPNQQVPSPSNATNYAQHPAQMSPVLSPSALTEESLYEQKYNNTSMCYIDESQSQEAMISVWEDELGNSQFYGNDDPYMLNYDENCLVESDAFWVESTIEA